MQYFMALTCIATQDKESTLEHAETKVMMKMKMIN